MSVTAILPAAGVGKRFGGNVKKQFTEFNGQPVLYYSLKCLRDAYEFDEFIIGASEDDFEFIHKVASSLSIKYRTVKGGDERWQTVFNCLLEVKSKHVLIHDAVRPFVPAEVVKDVIKAGQEHGAAICCVPVSETLKKVGEEGVVGTLDRSQYVLSHTPQVFDLVKLITAVSQSARMKINLTDESMAMEMAGNKVKFVPSTRENIKITYSADVDMVKSLMVKYYGNL